MPVHRLLMLAWGDLRPRTIQLGGQPPARHAAPNPQPDYAISWDDYVRLSFEEIRKGAVASVQVTRRLRASFDDLLQCAPEELRPPLERQLRLLDVGIESNGPVNMDSDVWRQSDPQGIGAWTVGGGSRKLVERAPVDRGASALIAVGTR